MFNKKKLVIFLIIVFFILPSTVSLLNLYTDWLFFEEIGLTPVFTTTLGAKIGTGASFGALMLIFTLANLLYACRANFPIVGIFGNFMRLKKEEAARLSKPLGVVVCAILAILSCQWGATQWENVMLFMNKITVGIKDPIIGQDLGFYFFQLPFLEMLKDFFLFMITTTIAIMGAVYYLRGGIAMTLRGLQVDWRVRRHLAVLLGICSLVLTAGFFLECFELLFSSSGAVHGAGYTDVNARLPAYRILCVLTPAAAILLVAGVWKGLWRKALLAPAIVFAVYGLGIMAYPAMLQKFKVSPNELDLEMPYIGNDIRFTRFGYDLDKIETIPFDADLKLTEADIVKNDATIKNIRLWDRAPLLKTYSQLQQIRTYYKFFDVDNDRYMVNGQYTQVMLSPRELSYEDLPSRNWINERLIFTHGNGLTIGPVSRISKEGLPEFFVKDIPAVSLADIRVTRPEIYYGELSNEYVIVRTKVPEFSYPTATGNINTTYGGKGGVSLGSLARKALFAAKFGTEKILLSSDITGESRILYYRNIGDRVKAVAPFLRFNNDPYMVVADDGRLKWIIDAYTASDHLPYAKPLQDGTNYLRNSVKVIIDAYDGTLGFYVSDQQDVIVRAYARIFPALFKPMTAMPADLRRHIRYPHQFLQIQAAMFAAYHMTDPKVFYNKENLWEVPILGDRQMEPYYMIMRLPSENREEYILLLPFTPSKRDNLAAWLTARCDEPNYGKLRAYTFPRDRLIYGPKQIDARINQDSFISQQLTLWNQHGSEVIRGSMLVIPIEKSLLYVQPLYLAAADKSGLPELRRVIVAYGDQVVMEENLELALARLFGEKRAPAGVAVAAAQEMKAPLSDLAREAMSIYEKAINLQRQGDWGGYGEELRRLEQVLKQMAR
jgi:hypothetical protein